MATYFIGYDLVDKKDYKRLIEALEGMAATKILASDWKLERDLTDTKEIATYLKTFIDEDDRLIVVKTSSAEWSTYNAFSEPK